MAITIMMLVDAFSVAYLNEEYTPFVYNIGKEGLLTTLKPLFAFRGIETTLFTGKWPSEHGVFAEMQFKSTHNPISDILFEVFIRTVDSSKHDKLMKLSRVIGEFIFRGTRSRLTPNLIPPKALRYFTASQHKPIYYVNGARVTTLFDILRYNNIRYAFIEPSIINGDRGIVEKIKRYRDKGIQFWYLKFSGFDREGHIYGPEPSMFREKIITTERYIKQIINILGGIDNINLLLLADHGMSRVCNYVNLMEILNNISEIKLYKDYITFVDSTLARFWFFNNVKDKILDKLNTLEFGHVVTDKERDNLHIPCDRAQTGDVMFVVDEGYAIYPDFWSGTRKPKGMHGYAYSNSKESLPIFITNSKMKYYYKDVPKDFTDVLNGIVSSLGVS
ncbi:MAG: alkaline phosphatase family protein [Candidatus Anstonellales archaeon]